MTPDQLKAKAKELYDYRQENAGLLGWKFLRKRWLRLCRNLAKRIGRNAAGPEAAAMYYLDVLALREDVTFEFKD